MKLQGEDGGWWLCLFRCSLHSDKTTSLLQGIQLGLQGTGNINTDKPSRSTPLGLPGDRLHTRQTSLPMVPILKYTMRQTTPHLKPFPGTLHRVHQGDRPHKVWHASFRQCELMRSQCTIQFLIIRRAVARIDWSVAYFDLLLHIHCMSSILPTNGGC